MNRRKFISDTGKYSFGGLFFPSFPFIKLNQIKISVKQLTQGPDHHFFGYIGQSLTIPWSKKRRSYPVFISVFPRPSCRQRGAC